MRDDEAFRQISDLIEQIYKYWELLKLKGIWLFLATLGCWSVEHRYICILALGTVGALFAEQVIYRLPNKKSFGSQAKDLLRKIGESEEISDKQKSLYLEEINIIENRILSFSHSTRFTWIFLICFLFYGLTVGAWFLDIMHV